MPSRKHTPSLGEKAYSYSPGPVLKTIYWINVTFDSSLTSNRSQDRKKALLLPLLFPRGYFFYPASRGFSTASPLACTLSFACLVFRVVGLLTSPGTFTSRSLSMKNLPTAHYFDFCFLYICFFCGLSYDRTGSRSPISPHFQ